MDPELSGSILRHLGVDVAFREALIVDRVDVARAKPSRPNLTPIAVRRVAFAEDMDVPRRTRRIGLTVEDLVLADEAQLDAREAIGVRVYVNPVSLLLGRSTRRLRRLRCGDHDY